MSVNTSGKILWKNLLGTGNYNIREDESNAASPSPSTDGQYVWVKLGTGILACYDFNGKEIWKFNLQERYKPFSMYHGMSSSALLDGDRLYLQLFHSNEQIVLALDKNTGREIWQHNRETDAREESLHSYASPFLYRFDNQEFLLTHGADERGVALRGVAAGRTGTAGAETSRGGVEGAGAVRWIVGGRFAQPGRAVRARSASGRHDERRYVSVCTSPRAWASGIRVRHRRPSSATSPRWPSGHKVQIRAVAKRGGWAAASAPTLEEFTKTGAWYAGPPEGLVAHLKDLEQRYPGLEYVNVSSSMGSPKAVLLEQLAWFARDVMPHFPGVTAALDPGAPGRRPAA